MLGMHGIGSDDYQGLPTSLPGCAKILQKYPGHAYRARSSDAFGGAGGAVEQSRKGCKFILFLQAKFKCTAAAP